MINEYVFLYFNKQLKEILHGTSHCTEHNNNANKYTVAHPRCPGVVRPGFQVVSSFFWREGVDRRAVWTCTKVAPAAIGGPDGGSAGEGVGLTPEEWRPGRVSECQGLGGRERGGYGGFYLVYVCAGSARRQARVWLGPKCWLVGISVVHRLPPGC